MSSPEGKILTPEGRIILSQDLPQYEQSVQKSRQERAKKEQTDYDTAQKEYEKDVKSAEAQYQKDLAEYNRQQAEIERLAKQQNKFDAEIARLEAQKQKELADAHYSVWGPDGSRNRSELASMQRTIEKNYDSKINKTVEQKRIQTGYQEFSALYPGQVLPSNVAKTFRESPSFSLTGLYEQKVESKAAKAEYQRQASVQTAQNIARRDSIEYHSNIPNIGFISSYGLQEGSQRAGAIKSTPEAHPSLLGGGKKAVETRRPLINVKTVETIYGGQQIETNPRAFVASLDRQNVDAAGKTIKPKQTEIIPIISPASEPIQTDGRWQVLVPGEDPRIFKTKESAEKYIQRRDPPQVQGPVFQQQESVYLPAGSLQYLLSTRQLQPKITISQSETQLGPEKPRPLESAIQFFGDVGKQYKDIQPIAFTTGAIEEGLGIIGGTINLIEKGKQKLGEFSLVKYPIKEVKKPYTLPASPFEYPLDVGYETIFQGTPLTLAEKQARARQVQIIKDEGGYRYSGKLAVTLATIPFRGFARTGEKITSGLLKPAKKEATTFLQKRTANMLDVRAKPSKPFSYDIPYTQTKRPNEINLSDFGERIGTATPISKRPIAARQSDVIIPKQKAISPVKEDLSYKPASRANEIRVSGILPKENIVGKIELSKGFIPNKIEKPLKGKIQEPVKSDPLFRPARRTNEIDLTRDTVMPSFTTTRIRLGKGTVQPRKLDVIGKKEKPIDEDFFYKPSKRPNEIDLSDFGEKIKLPKIEPEKSEVPLDLTRELKRLKRKQPEFKSEKVSFGGEGIYLSGKRQSLVLVKRQEELTKKKLITKRKTPLSINWSEQIQTIQIPKTGKSPIQILVPREKEKKKKAYLQEQSVAIQSYDVPLSAQRPKIKSVQRSEIRQEFKLSSPQRIQESLKFETAQPQRLAQRPKTVTRQLSIPKYEIIPIQRVTPRQAQKTTPKLSSPLAPKAPTRLRAPQRQPLREKPVQLLRTRPPRKPPRVIFALPPDKDPEKKKSKKESKDIIGFYLGNVPETQISGIFKRKEITLGKKKIERTRRGDVRVLLGKSRTQKRSKKQEDMFGFKKGKTTKFF